MRVMGALFAVGCGPSAPHATGEAPSAPHATGEAPVASEASPVTRPPAGRAVAPSESGGESDELDPPADRPQSASGDGPADTADSADGETVAPRSLADVIRVRASGESGALSFSVRVRSPDTGCDRYANYWEVLAPDGKLLYRRILAHSHVDEQPFTRAGGPVLVRASDTVIVRAHMHPGGYGGAAMRGSLERGFQPAELDAGFAAGVGDQEPRPTRCAF